MLQDHHSNASNFQTEFFGQFKGFKLSPIGSEKSEPDTTKPQRSAPPVPAVVPTIPSIVIKSPLHVVRPNITQTTTVSTVRPLAHKQPSIANALINSNSTSAAPALPPPNPGSNPRPLISSPILENSTCTAKELISPLRTAPKIPSRPAPDQPEVIADNKRPLSSTTSIVPQEEPIVKKPKEGGSSTLNRIASFLKSKDDKKVLNNSNSLPRNNIKASKILDKNALRTMEISGPIPQNEIEIAVTALPVEEGKKSAVVMRAQSLRGNNVTPRPNIPNFGSMRQPNFKRPTSIPVGNRPKSPPPPRPPLPEGNAPSANRPVNKIPGLPGYQTPTTKSTDGTAKTEYHYDDCMNEAPLAQINEEMSPTSGDNIYAVIEESPKPFQNVKSNSGSSESVGLLGEIVSEIQNRNFDSIYSTSTLARKQKEKLLKEQQKQIKENDSSDKSLQLSPDASETNDTYVNTSSIFKSPESVYSNMGNLKSSASSTASGYIHPSAVNAPVVKQTSVSNSSASFVAKTTNTPPKTVLSTFKSDPKPDINTYKPFSSTLQRSSGPLASAYKANALKKQTETTESTPTPSTNANNPMSPTARSTLRPLTRQITPPNVTTNRQSTPSTTSPPISRQTTPPNLTRQTPSPTIKRQITPPNLRTRKPSPTRTVPPSPKNLPKSTTAKPQNNTSSNSPDLVISCSNTTANTKSPDVLNSTAKMNGKPTSVLPKPQNVTPKTAPKTVKSLTDKKPVLIKSSSDVKPPITVSKANSDVSSNVKALPAGSRLAAKQASNVASLQQKFEIKPPVASKVIAAKKK